MAYTIAAGAICEVQCRGSLFGQQVLMVRHYQRNVEESDELPDGKAALSSILDSFDAPDTGWTATAKAYWTVDFTVQSVRAQWIYPTRYAYLDRAPAFGAGTQAPPTVPQNATCVITLKSDFGGRHGNGNVFLTGFEQAQTFGGIWTGLQLGHMAVLGDFLTQTFSFDEGAHEMLPVIYRRALPNASATVTGYAVQPEIRTMRRRTVGRGV